MSHPIAGHHLTSALLRNVAGVVVPAGTDLGLWVVNKLDVGEQYFMTDGTPLEIRGTLTITEYGEDAA